MLYSTATKDIIMQFVKYSKMLDLLSQLLKNFSNILPLSQNGAFHNDKLDTLFCVSLFRGCVIWGG